MSDLILKENNAYSIGYVVEFDEVEKILVREPLGIKGDESDRYHTVTDFDRLDLLAWKYYQNYVEDASKYWWLIADANNIQNPLDLEEFIGKQILIPDIIRVKLEL